MTSWIAFTNVADADADDNYRVDRIGTHVYLYGEVSYKSCLSVYQHLADIDAELHSERFRRSLPDDFPSVMAWLHINSNGGSVHPALGLVDNIRRMETPVYSICEGFVASAATLIAFACHKRFVTPSTVLMIHQISGQFWGSYEEMKDHGVHFDLLMKIISDFYEGVSNISHDEIRDMLQRNTFMSPQDALEKGFIDSIYT